MKNVYFKLQNISGERTSFTYRVLRRNYPIEGRVTEVLNEETETFEPGEVIEVNVPWPFEQFTPFQCIWAPRDGYMGRWEIRDAHVDGRKLVANLPARF